MRRQEKSVRRYSEGLKRHIVEEIEEGRMTPREAARVYGVSGGSRSGVKAEKYARSAHRSVTVIWHSMPHPDYKVVHDI